MITAVCRPNQDNSHIVEFLINNGGDVNLQNNVSYWLSQFYNIYCNI